MKVISKNQHKFRVAWKTRQLSNPIQGNYGTCLLLAAGEGTTYEWGRNRHGETVYRFKFFTREMDGDSLNETLLTKQVRVAEKDDLPLGSNGVWGAYETAYARTFGDDILHQGSYPSTVLPQVSGKRVGAVSLSWENAESTLQQWFREGQIVIFVSDPDTQALLPSTSGGLKPAVERHAYRAKSLGNGYMRMVNPWGYQHINPVTVADLVAAGEGYGTFYSTVG